MDECASCKQAVAGIQDDTPVGRWLGQSVDDTTGIDPLLSRLTESVRDLGAPQHPSSAGEYDILEPIGRGGMSQVYRARHRRMNRVVALKTLTPAMGASAEAVRRFRREVEALARLSHPHIVAAYDAFEEKGKLYLAMEYIEGESLDKVVRDRGPLPVAQALDFIKQAARGLEQAHAAGVTHRDIKPANLIVDKAGVVKILDLGLARLSLPDRPVSPEDLTGGSIVMGTAAYMAPEQALDPRNADARADVYSLGCTLHFLLTGNPPYRGASVMGTLLAHRDEPIPSLRTSPGRCPYEVDALFRKMLAKRPADRPASLSAVVAELERLGKPSAAGFLSRRRWLIAGAGVAAAAASGVWLTQLLQPDPRATSYAAPAPDKTVSPKVEMVEIKAGSFFMGAPDKEEGALPDEKPRHEVKISRGFLLGKYEVTQEQFEEVMGTNPSAFSAKGKYRDKVKDVDTKKHPVDSISWENAIAFCNKLSLKHGLAPYYRLDKDGLKVLGGKGYRLPTEAEWEYACRAGSGDRWSFGDNPREINEYAWNAANSEDRTHRVGTRKANAWGLFDMHGNLPEWCWDRYEEVYYERSPGSDPGGSGKGGVRVHRGGGWNQAVNQLRASARNPLGSAYSVNTIVGMRVARDL